MERPQTSSLPTTPGIYCYKDADDRIIYVGKARNLRRRILSYFRGPEYLTAKTRAMLAHAVSIETLSTGTEKEALLLEASLIKKYRPHYNIILRDDKQYVLFCIARSEQYPRLEIVRNTKKARARYFGPFTSGMCARETWKAIHHVFPLRRCSERAMAGRTRPCLYYDLGQCLAPCVKKVDPAVYGEMVHRVELFLSGRSRELISELTGAMQQASEAMEFERAAVLRDQLRAIQATVERQSVVLPDGGDMDVAGVADVAGGLGLCLLFVREGKLMDGRTFFWPDLGGEDKPELLWSFLGQFYVGEGVCIPPRLVVPDFGGAAAGGGPGSCAPARNESFGATSCADPSGEQPSCDESPREALESFLSELGRPVKVRPPRGAAERALLEMAESNAREAKTGQNRDLSARLGEVFHVAFPVRRVACVDVSHTGGMATRVGVVFFTDGRPDKAKYRTYAVEGTGGDDYAALAQWAARYAVRNGESSSGSAELPGTEKEDARLSPELLLIDGGRGQVAAVARALREAGCVRQDGSFPFLLAGIAKARTESGRADRRAGNVSDRIFLAGRSNPLPLRAGAPELLFLQRVRDEAHRFSVSRHRRARERQSFASELEKLPGIGKATAKRLWDAFGTLDAILAADAAALEKVPGFGKTMAFHLAEQLHRLQVKLRRTEEK